MNAYELAQCLEDMADFDECEYTKAANMIRQQADRIAELEKQCAKYEELIASWNTPQTKPLSDEEILDLCPPNHSAMMNEAYTIDFARAIEERHGIK